MIVTCADDVIGAYGRWQNTLHIQSFMKQFIMLMHNLEVTKNPRPGDQSTFNFFFFVNQSLSWSMYEKEVLLWDESNKTL